MALTTASPDKKKARPIPAADTTPTDDHLPPSINLLDISACGNNVASFLSFNERGRLLLVNHQFNDEKWGMVKEKTYGPSGMSAADAARLILRVACSEFGPERLAECGSSNDAISALRGGDYDYEFSERLEDWSELKKFWCSSKNCYDISSIEHGFPLEWGEDDRKEMKCFFLKVNELLSQLKTACDYLEDLELKATAFPDLYEYLIEEAGVVQKWLDRFAEIRQSTWGKAHFHDEDPLSYHTRDSDGTLVFNSIDQVFPGQDTISALPSKSYTPKPLHFRQCIKCHNLKHDISYFECPYKWCEQDHKGKCGDCAPTCTCASCGKSGCVCCFVECSREGCTRMMCKCTDFFGWKDSDRGGAPGCSYLAHRGNGDHDDSGMGQNEYCDVHKPDGAVKHETAVCVIM